MSGKTLKYLRTTQGFMVFPPLAATHEMVANATGWPKLSAGFVDWELDGTPFCHGESDTLGIGMRADDTAALCAEWGLSPPAALELTGEPLKAALAFGADLDGESLEQAEVT